MKWLFKYLCLLLFSSQLFAQFNLDTLLTKVDAAQGQINKQAVVDSFMNMARADGIPVIQDSLVTFIYKKNIENVSLGGDFNNWSSSFKKPMERIDSTDFWYQQKSFEPNARFDYAFLIDENYFRDPENSNSGSGSRISSELAMPDYEQPWEIETIDSVAKGTLLIKTLQYATDSLSKRYAVFIYLPAGYDGERKQGYPVAYFQDGSGYFSNGGGRALQIFDNLNHFKKIEPTIAVFVNPTNRTEEYLTIGKERYADFFANTLTGYIDSVYNTNDHPKSRLVMGPSFGGNISAFIAYNYPEKFGNCGLHSAAFRPFFDVYYQVTGGVKKDIDFYAIWGTYEHPIHIDMRDFKKRLLSKGYNFLWAEYPEGHNWGFWRARTDDILEHFFPFKVDSVNTEPEIPERFHLKQNFPNPFNPSTTISYELKTGSKVSLKVYDLLGREVRTLVNTAQEAGFYDQVFDASNLASGVYYYNLKANGINQTKKMLLLR